MVNLIILNSIYKKENRSIYLTVYILSLVVQPWFLYSECLVSLYRKQIPSAFSSSINSRLYYDRWKQLHIWISN